MWKLIWSDGTWKQKHLFHTWTPVLQREHNTNNKWVRVNWKTQTRIKIMQHPQLQLTFHTRPFLNVERKITRQCILKYKLNSVHSSSVWSLCIFPLFFFTITSYTLSTLHPPTQTPPTPLFSLFFCQSEDRGHAGSACQSKAGSAEEAASNAR